MPKNIRLIIFDLDGTLIDAFAAVTESVNYTLSRLGYPPVHGERIKRSVGWGEVHLLGCFVKRRDMAQAARIYRRHHPASLRRGTKLLPGARQVLRRLRKQGYGIAIASNRAKRFTALIVQHLGISGDIDFSLCRDQVARPKPYPDMVKKILERFGLTRGEALFVGDMVVDIVAGRRAGIPTVAVLTGSCRRRELAAAKPYRIIADIGGLSDVLKGMEKTGGSFRKKRWDLW
jgi:phosphoglycolate phosphatase